MSNHFKNFSRIIRVVAINRAEIKKQNIFFRNCGALKYSGKDDGVCGC